MKMTREQKTELWDLVMLGGLHSHRLGYTKEEIEILKSKVEEMFWEIKEDRFNRSLLRNEALYETGRTINYPIDVYLALLAGLEDRDISSTDMR